jgi:hypothetical protein
MSAAAGAAGALIAIQSERKHREIVSYFESQRALDPSSAIALSDELRLDRSVIVEMLRHGELLDVGGGKYWLDRDRAEMRQARSKRRTANTLTIFSAIAAVAALAVLSLR